VKRSRGVAKQLNSGVGHLMKKNKVTVVMGEATLPAKGKVSVKTDKGTEELTARNIILATGARARELPGLEADGERGLDLQARADTAAYAEEAAGDRLGRHRHRIRQLLQHARRRHDRGRGHGPHPARRGRGDLHLRQEELREAGHEDHGKAMVKKLDRAADKVTAHIEVGGKVEKHDFDTVISAVGIVGNTEGLGLEKLGVKIDRTFVVTDEYCRTGVEGLFAIGDATGAPWLAHKASHEGVMVAEIIAGKNNVHPVAPENIAGCTYCHPQVASSA
jgi:dihydrolipoamide dehydrogenase